MILTAAFASVNAFYFSRFLEQGLTLPTEQVALRANAQHDAISALVADSVESASSAPNEIDVQPSVATTHAPEPAKDTAVNTATTPQPDATAAEPPASDQPAPEPQYEQGPLFMF